MCIRDRSPAAPAAVDNAVHAEGSSGHVLRDGFRRISEATAKKNREAWHMWYMANRDRKAIANRKFYQANREKARDRQRVNREKINERKRMLRKAKREARI